MSNQQGRAPFISAWGLRRRLASDHLAIVRTPEINNPVEVHSVWIDWWMTAVTVGSSNTRSLNDSLGGGPVSANVVRGPGPQEY